MTTRGELFRKKVRLPRDKTGATKTSQAQSGALHSLIALQPLGAQPRDLQLRGPFVEGRKLSLEMSHIGGQLREILFASYFCDSSRGPQNCRSLGFARDDNKGRAILKESTATKGQDR